MPSLDTGRYTIINAGVKNVATLNDVNSESCISGGIRQDRDSEKVLIYVKSYDVLRLSYRQWNIVLLSNGKYTIKSYATGLYANHEPNPKKGENVFGSTRAQNWKIKEMRTPGHYVYVIYTRESI
jgi:hypothetical protein